MSHILELLVHHSILFKGGLICFASPFTLTVKEGGAYKRGDLEMIKPTLFAAVPRVFDMIKKGISNKVAAAGTIPNFLFNWIMKKKYKQLEKNNNVGVWFEGFVLNKIREKMGLSNVRTISVGGAPLSKDSHYFIQSLVGKDCNIITAYASTETAAAGISSYQLKFSGTNHVGYCHPSLDLKLVDVPDMNYYVDKEGEQPSGEILFKGLPVSKGYYKRKELSDKSFIDGWFHTGDIGRLNKDGTISIIDRKKNIVKLSHGEYIALEKLEHYYGVSSFVTSNGYCICVNPEKPYYVAVVNIDQVFVERWAKENSIQSTDINVILKDEALQKAIFEDLKRIGKEQKLNDWEIPREILIVNDEWNTKNDMLTVSMKLKRRSIKKKYESEIEKAYLNIKEDLSI